MLNLFTYTLFAGSTWKSTETISGYSPALYNLIIVLKYLTNAAITIEYTENESGVFEGTYSAASALPGGEYTYHAYVELISDSTVKYTVETGRKTILADISTAATDPRTFAEKMVDKIEAQLLILGDKPYITMSVNGISKAYNREELLKIRDQFRYEAGVTGLTSNKIMIYN